MKRKGLKNLILNQLKENTGWNKKVDLYVLSYENGYSPESLGRCLRALEKEEIIKVDYYTGAVVGGLAMYALVEYEKPKPEVEIVEINGVMTARYI